MLSQSMTDSTLRRTFIATLGALGVGAGTASGDHGHESKQQQNTTVSQEQSVSVKQEQTVRYDEREECAKCTTDDGRERRLGTLVVTNRSPCQRKVQFGTTGRAAEEGNTLQDDILSLQVPGNGRCRVGFTGTVSRYNAEPADLDVIMEQRSEHEASHC